MFFWNLIIYFVYEWEKSFFLFETIILQCALQYTTIKHVSLHVRGLSRVVRKLIYLLKKIEDFFIIFNHLI